MLLVVSFIRENVKTKIQKAQNKCTCFGLNLPPRSHTDPPHFRKINWPAATKKVEYCIV